jgi:hypothetical protein
LFGKKINLNNWVWYMAKVGGSLAYYHAAGDSKGKIVKRMTPIISLDADFEDGELTEADLEIIKP